jgi:hypothetical protein
MTSDQRYWRCALVTMTICLACCACGSSNASKLRGSTGGPTTAPASTASTVSRSVPLNISSTSLTVGEQITVGGGSCPSGDIGQTSLTQDPNGGPQVTYNYGEYLGQTNAGPTDHWTLHTTLPGMIIGPARLVGDCLDPSTGAPDITYSPTAVNVATPYRLQVEPATSVRAGATVTVSSLGGGCDSLSDPDVYLWSATQHNPLTGIGEVVGPAGNAGPWSVNLTVPATTSPGEYQVVARCAYSRSYRITYEPEPLMVLAG